MHPCVWPRTRAGTGNTWPWARALVSLQGSCEGTVIHWSQLSTFVRPGGMLGFCSGVNVLNHSSPWKCRRPVSQSLARKAPIPTSLPKSSHQRLDSDWESLRRKLLLSQVICILPSDGVRAQSPSLESNFSTLSHTHCICHSAVTPPSFLVCTHARSLTRTLILAHPAAHAPSLFWLLPSLPDDSHHLGGWDL